MKNIMKNNTILSALTAVLFVTVLSFGATATFAHAQEFDGGFDFGSDTGSGCCGDTSYSGNSSLEGIDYSYTPSYSDYSGNSSLEGIDYTYPPTYDSTGYSTGGSMAGSYPTGGYSTGGYSTGGYSSGGFSTGGYMIGSSYPIQTAPIIFNNPVPSNTSIYAPTNTNTCTGNSCNSDDHSVVNISNPAPVINNNNVIASTPSYQPPAYQPPAYQQQYCQSGYYGTYPNCYRQQMPVYQQPMAYNNTPYVSLSQVPYTGLDLGFWGTIAYWGAFVLFALFAAYLIAIKRVQNNIARSLKVLLFGESETAEEAAAPAAEAQVETVAAPAVAAEAQTNGDMIDSFIMSQVNRARTA
jgi:hypothetical protein